jgi:hypothetical protein
MLRFGLFVAEFRELIRIIGLVTIGRLPPRRQFGRQFVCRVGFWILL